MLKFLKFLKDNLLKKEAMKKIVNFLIELIYDSIDSMKKNS